MQQERSIENTAIDALQHIFIEGRRRDDLIVETAYKPWRIQYPLYIRNTRPIPIDIIGYNATLLWDDSAVDRITWRAPDSDASNGIPIRPNNEPVEALTIQADHPYTLHIPVNIKRINIRPAESPRWGIRGTIMVRCNEAARDVTFNFNTDYYEMPPNTFFEWLIQADAN